MGIRCADHVTPFCPQKLALTSPTGGGRSVGIVRSRTKATEFSLAAIEHTNLKILIVKSWDSKNDMGMKSFMFQFFCLLFNDYVFWPDDGGSMCRNM